MISELPGNSYCSLLFYCPYYTKVITIKIPKYLAGCFLLLLNWGSFLHFQVFTPTSLLPCPVRLGNFPLFQEFTPTSLLSALVPLGNFPLFQEFTPTSLLPATAQLGDFSLFPEFTPTSLLPALVPLGNFPYFRNLPQPACFLLLFHCALVNKFWTRNIKKYSVTLYGCIRHTPPLTSLQETLGR